MISYIMKNYWFNYMKEQILQWLVKRAEWNTIIKAYKGHCCSEIPNLNIN